MRHNSLDRSGMSLLEILVTLFILSVGLLGVAALIPLGNHAVNEAMKADRSSTCGRAMMDEMKIRGWVDPLKWIGHDGTTWTSVVTGSNIRYRDSFVIDPLFLAEPPLNDWKAPFPFGVNPNIGPLFDPTDDTAALRRVTLNVGTTGMSLSSAIQHFTWHDDLVLPTPTDADDRPRQTVLWSNGEGSAWPYRPADGSTIDTTNDIPLKAEDSSDYTWMATVTPVIDPMNNTGGASDVNAISHYSVSIVVFYKRDVRWLESTGIDPDTPPAERSVVANMVGGGWGGGDVQLVVDLADPSINANWLNVRKDQWIMLRALDPGSVSGPVDDKIIANWYRVIAVDPEVAPVTGGVGRYVTLSGPDWWPTWDSVNNTGVMTYATLIDDVVGVYTTTVEADLNSAWTQ